MSITITQEKYTALVPLIHTLPGFARTTPMNNDFTLKFAFHSGFACCISNNTKNTNLSVHFENIPNDVVAHLTIMNAITGNL